MKKIITKTIPDEYNGKTVYCYLKSKLDFSQALIRKLKRRDNGIVVNGRRVFVNYTLLKGDVLKITIEDLQSSQNIPIYTKKLNIVFEDDDLLIIDKPANVPTLPPIKSKEGSIAGMVMNYYLNKGERFVFRCINRLDKGTSGLMVIAKHAHAQEKLKKQLHTNSFVRQYTALVKGTILNSGFVEAPIKRVDNSVIKRCVDSTGKYAFTSYRVLEHFNNSTLLKLQLKTGRTHQIRVHLSYIGHPLIGDFLYGEQSSYISRPALHSSYIKFRHPLSSLNLEFNSPLPSDIKLLKE